MIFVKSTLADVAAVIIAAVIYGLAAGVPRILELIPSRSREGGMGFLQRRPFSNVAAWGVALLISSGGFYWSFRRATRHR